MIKHLYFELLRSRYFNQIDCSVWQIYELSATSRVLKMKLPL